MINHLRQMNREHGGQWEFKRGRTNAGEFTIIFMPALGEKPTRENLKQFLSDSQLATDNWRVMSMPAPAVSLSEFDRHRIGL